MLIHITLRGGHQLPPLDADIDVPLLGLDTYQLDKYMKIPHNTPYCATIKHVAHMLPHIDFSMSRVDFDLVLAFEKGLSIRLCRPEKYKAEQDFMADFYRRVKEANPDLSVPTPNTEQSGKV